jgi:hypothetical protein
MLLFLDVLTHESVVLPDNVCALAVVLVDAFVPQQSADQQRPFHGRHTDRGSHFCQTQTSTPIEVQRGRVARVEGSRHPPPSRAITSGPRSKQAGPRDDSTPTTPPTRQTWSVSSCLASNFLSGRNQADPRVPSSRRQGEASSSCSQCRRPRREAQQRPRVHTLISAAAQRQKLPARRPLCRAHEELRHALPRVLADAR